MFGALPPVELSGADAVTAVTVPTGSPAAGKYPISLQLPEPSLTISTESPAAVIISAAPGRINVVALYCNVIGTSKFRMNLDPAGKLPKDVMVAEPELLMWTKLPVAAIRLQLPIPATMMVLLLHS